ncbi:MAG: type II toxin-antitoxin system VapC family toxin [Nitrososphaerota archaeon]|nr:type II toxin-antitoxin system VapC family toxin [Nitrososphaerota archaeon]
MAPVSLTVKLDKERRDEVERFVASLILEEGVKVTSQEALGVGRLALESPRVEKLFTGAAEFHDSWEKFQSLGKKPLSFTDCVSLVHMERRGIERIMSFDSGFDGLATCIH